MSDEIIFYHNPMSRARIIHYMLEEVGAPYRIELISLQKGEHKQSAFLEVNPMGKLPAIVHRGVVVTEAAAICTYLADAFPAAQLAPRLDEPARGTYLRWMFFGAGCVDPGFMDKMLQRPAPEQSGALGYGTFENMALVLEQAITPGPWILGDRFSAADVYVGSQINFGMMTKVLEPRPIFTAYAARIAQRPAFKRFNDQTNELMAQQQSQQPPQQRAPQPARA